MILEEPRFIIRLTPDTVADIALPTHGYGCLTLRPADYVGGVNQPEVMLACDNAATFRRIAAKMTMMADQMDARRAQWMREFNAMKSDAP